MANRKVALLWYCRTPQGWRRYPVIESKNGRIKHGFVLVDGIPVEYPDGRYELRTYHGRKPVYTRAGENSADALAERKTALALLKVKADAPAAKVRIVEESGRVYLRRAADLFVQDAIDRQALEAAEINKHVTDEFIALTKLTFADEVTSQHVYDFHKALRKRGCGDRTVANKHARLKAFFKYAKMAYTDLDILPPAPKYDDKLPIIYTPEETRAILDAADPYMRVVIELGLKCGLREQELMHLEWSDIEWGESVLRVKSKPLWDFKIKDSEERDIGVPSELIDILKSWRQEHPGRLVVGTNTDKPNGHLLRTLKRLAKRHGLNCGICKGCNTELGECQQWTLHKLRRTYCTTLLRNGVDIKTVRLLMGHNDVASTERYLRPVTGRELQAKINTINWG
jgi:integrase